MSHPDDSDLLRKAAAAMRAERTGHNAGSGFTRARILNDVRAARKKRSRWWRIGFPVGIILAGTTAWAAASSSWPEMLVNISTILNMPLTDNGASERSLATAKSTNPARARPSVPEASGQPTEAASQDPAGASEASAAETHAVLPEPAPEPAVAALETATAHTTSNQRSTRRRSQRAATRAAAEPHEVTNAATTEAPSPPPPELEAEIRAFRRADDLYRRSGDLQGAIGAYRTYMRDYPTGRFVPEAKYNTALALVKLGRASEARSLLGPFADGAYGTYRQEAARKLLEALP